MPHYRVHRIKESPRENFRWAAHTGGLAIVKPKDYEPVEELQAQNPYELWQHMRTQSRPLRPGDLLEDLGEGPHERNSSAVTLSIAKYIGFEPAQWFVFEPQVNEAVLPVEPLASFDQDMEARPS